ncbi:MAG: OmpA family protein [Elusimicrobia bacterium]|nr:OmpA family protein [Elusimicrobiota bacterium]
MGTFRVVLAILACALSSAGLSACRAHDEDEEAIGYKRPVERPVDPIKAQQAIDEIVKTVWHGTSPNVEFDFDSDELRDEAQPVLDSVVNLMLTHPDVKLMLLGHTDIIGTEEYNADLAARRGKAVKTYLVSHGVPPPSIRYHTFGFSLPAADNATDEGRQRNRRVELRLTPREWLSVF